MRLFRFKIKLIIKNKTVINPSAVKSAAILLFIKTKTPDSVKTEPLGVFNAYNKQRLKNRARTKTTSIIKYGITSLL